MQGVVKQAISDFGFVDIARLGIIDLEEFVRRMLVCLGGQVIMKGDDVGHEIALEFLDVLPVTFSSHKFIPCLKKIFDGNDIIVGMSELDPTQTMKAPPPTGFCRS